MCLRFEPPDHDRFPAIRLAKQALAAGGTMPAAFNAANEVAVERFCRGDLRFSAIWQVVGSVLAAHVNHLKPDLEKILDDDRRARDLARRIADTLILSDG
jgi:1-deoxy-D-xylulose-5-phosphate reductoisomerase